MKIIKFISKCIFEGLKIITPTVFIIIAMWVGLNYLAMIIGLKAFTIFMIAILILIFAFIFGIIKLEHERLCRKENRR